jgi:exopolysaccharide biosynthesis protein
MCYHTEKPHGILARLNYCTTTIDMRSGNFRVVPILAHMEQDERFEDLISRSKPYAAITGTFYGPECRPLGDVLVDGKLACRGFQRQGIGFTRSGKIVFVERHGSSRIDWSGCYAGVACGPRLLRNGKIDINVRRDGFTASAANIEATRCAVGATKDGKLVMLAIRQSVTLHAVAQAMKELGAVDAVNMDGGALCAFYADGECKAQPIRPMSNIIAVYKVK